MIKIKTKEQIQKIKQAGKIIAKCHDGMDFFLEAGLTTLAIDEHLKNIIAENGGKSAAKGYKGYPRYTCISVNSAIVHGIPGDYVIKDGDVVSVDIALSCQGYIADACKTYIVGEGSKADKHLVKETENAFWSGVKEVKAGVRLSNVSHAIGMHAIKNGFSVIKEFCGHGVGFELHEEPLVPNHGKKNRGPLLKEGMVLAIEPIFSLGKPEIRLMDDGWTYITADGKNASHFEHTLAVTQDGYELLTTEDL